MYRGLRRHIKSTTQITRSHGATKPVQQPTDPSSTHSDHESDGAQAYLESLPIRIAFRPRSFKSSSDQLPSTLRCTPNPRAHLPAMLGTIAILLGSLPRHTNGTNAEDMLDRSEGFLMPFKHLQTGDGNSTNMLSR